MKFLKFIPLGILASILWSCQTEDTSEETAPTTITQTANIEMRSLMGSDVPVSKQEDGTYLIGGEGSDMAAFEENFDGANSSANPLPELPGRSAITIGGNGQVRKWPNNTVIYRIGNITAQMRERFDQAIQEWESKTAIRFKERTDENFYVTVNRTGDGCNCGVATIGVFRNQGFIRIGSQASVAIIIHEIGHTLGYLHEQNRADRNEYVNVLFQNIVDGAEDQFFVSENSIPLTDELDLNSVMMYRSFTFSKDGRSPTIVDLNGNPYRKNAPGLSQGDINGTNQAYPPTDQEEEEETTTDDTTTDDTNTNTNTDTETETDTTTDTDDDDTNQSACNGVNEYNRNNFYRVGDKVTFRGYLYQRDFSRWILLGSCEEAQTADICEGISEYNRSINYGIGNQVTFRGNLYRRVVNGWLLEGQCGN